MGETTKIAWTDHTWSPWWGYTKVSEGCKHCYADSWSRRVGHSKTGSLPVIWGDDAERRFMSDEHWEKPRRWDRKAAKAGVQAKVFPSMCDPFEFRADLVPQRNRLFRLIEETPMLIWQLLTKRPENIHRMVPPAWLNDGFPPNVWLGTTIENNKARKERELELLRYKVKVRFFSVEPMIEDVRLDLRDRFWCKRCCHLLLRDECASRFGKVECPNCLRRGYVDQLDFRKIHWVIFGGESGPGARPCALEWFERGIDRCRKFDVNVFVKQLGLYVVSEERVDEKGDWAWRMGTKHPKGEDPEEFPPHLHVQEFPGEAKVLHANFGRRLEF